MRPYLAAVLALAALVAGWVGVIVYIHWGGSMKIRDAHATINGDKTEYEMPSGALEIIADDGRTLFSIHLNEDGSIDVDTGSTCKHGGVVLDTGMRIAPRSSNRVFVSRVEYKTGV